MGSGAINARIGALGEMAGVSDILLQKQYAINKANLEGAGITQAQSNAILESLRNRTLGIDVIRASTDAQNVEAETIGMSAGAAAEYTAVQNRLNEAKRNGQVLIESEIAAIRANAAALGEAAQRTDNLRAGYTIFSGTMQDLNQQIRQNGLNWNTLGTVATNALGRISDKLMQMATDNLWKAAFPTGGAGGGGGIFSLFSSIFGGGGGLTNVVGGAGSLPVPTFAANGNVFGGPGINAYSNQIISRPTVFAFANGAGIMGEDGDEGVLPLTRVNGKLGVHAAGAGRGAGAAPQVFNYVDNRVYHDTSPQVVAAIQARDKQEWPKKKAEIFAEMRKQRGRDPNAFAPA